MDITTINVSILLVGVPACAGAFFVARYYGSSRVSNGVYLLVLAIGVTFTTLFLLPEGALGRGDYSEVMPWMLVFSGLLGALIGYITKRRRNDS